MRNNELKTTMNSYVFNRAYKKFLEKKGKIRCSYCGYHRGENNTNNSYGGFPDYPSGKINHIKYPNWKLVSKQPKQWMKKPLKKKWWKSRVWQNKGYNFIW